MQGVPKLSVVLPTYKRPDTLRRTLEHLAAQDLDPESFEIIVIEDGLTDATPPVVEEMRSKMPQEVRFLYNDTNHGPGYTQNRGIREARAPINLILADDIFLAPGALRAHLELHEANPEREFALMGKAIQSPELNQSVFLRNWEQFGFVDLEDVDELPYYWFWGCNVSFKREFMLEHGMFLDHRGRGGGAAHEDVELGYRLHLAGMRLGYCQEAWGYHYHVYTLDQAVNRYYERGLNWEEFRKHMPDAECGVSFHVLNRDSWNEYRSVFKRPNSLRGSERYFAWHVFRHVVFTVLLNRVTAPLIWRPILDGAEKSTLLEKLVNRQVYRAYLYFHFIKGVADAKHRFRTQAVAR